MNKYNNNFSRAPAGDSPMRFNKRPRYGANNNGGNNSPRYKRQNQTGYKYSPSRSNTTDSYQSNQYEKNSRNFYGISSNRTNHKHQQQNKQSPSYLHKAAASSSLSPSSSSLSGIMPNVFNSQQNQPNTTQQAASVAMTAQNNLHHQQLLTPNIMDNSNYYGYDYNNFYPNNYNTDLLRTASAPTFGVGDGMSPFMWQTITSTPPPKLPQQQPSLPQQPPPSLQPPPLPSDDKLPQLPPPPPLPPGIAASSASLFSANADHINNKSNDKDSAAKTIIKMKAKRKAMSTRYKLSKSWSEEDALLALKAEESNTRKLQNDIILILRFPDPEISREIVKCYSPDIESVHFQLNFAPRYCLIHLKPGTDVEKTIDHLSKIPFGTGFLSVEIKQIPHKTHSTKLSEIDPHTLYVGNLPTTIACKTLKEHFPGAARIDIGFAQRMKYTRYAFIRYQNVQQAIEAYKRMLDAEIGGRTLTIRFRRLTTSNEGSKDDDAEIPDEMTETLEDNSIKLSQTGSESRETIENSEVENTADIAASNSNDVVNETERDTADNLDKNIDRPTTNESTESQNGSKSSMLDTENNCAQSQSCSLNENNPIEKIQQNSSTEITVTTEESTHTALLNIKPDPDNIDPEDIVIRNDAITSRLKINNGNIKQEEESALYMEFFAPPNKVTDNNSSSRKEKIAEKSIGNDIISLSSTTDEADTMSNVSINSLGEFLQNCQRSQAQANDNETTDPSPAKRNKASNDVLPATIKREILENSNINSRGSVPQESLTVENVKQEHIEDNENLNIKNSNLMPTGNTAQNSSLTINKIVPKRKVRLQSPTTATTEKSTSHNINNNDDMVPPTALFFRRDDHQNTFANSSSAYDYDEFYGTTVANIKREPLDTARGRNNIENGKRPQNAKEINTNKTSNNETFSSNPKINTISKTSKKCATSNAIDDDDLVPAHNLLGSYQPSQNDIKYEIEHDDIFSVPVNKSKDLNENSVLAFLNNNDSVVKLTSQSSKSDEQPRSREPLKDNDDDVIIISDNISRQPNRTNSNETLFSNSFFPRQTDLVTFKPKPAALAIPNREVSKLFYGDDLDKLYEQLDADSDSEL